MPYSDKAKDRTWHKLKMRRNRVILKLSGRFVTPRVTPKLDNDGNMIYED